MISSNRLCLIMPYYGCHPPYLMYFLKSIENLQLDVLFFSDHLVTDAPANFKQFRLGFVALNKLILGKLGIAPNLNSARRMCDFKPMFGKIFEDYIKEYDYWAFGDCDLVFGRKMNEVIQIVLNGKYDIASMRKCWISGPFTIFKNTRKINDLFMRAQNWKEIVTWSGDCIGFDEFCGPYHAAVERGEMTYEACRKHCDNFTSVVFRQREINFFHQNVIIEDMGQFDINDFIVRMKNGILTLDGVEICAFHYVCVKIRKYFQYVVPSYASSGDFIINEGGFYVSFFQKSFRGIILWSRKWKAALISIRRNGLRRMLPGWRKSIERGIRM